MVMGLWIITNSTKFIVRLWAMTSRSDGGLSILQTDATFNTDCGGFLQHLNKVFCKIIELKIEIFGKFTKLASKNFGISSKKLF